MKKLALVTLLAVAASWLIFEARQAGDPRPPMSLTFDNLVRNDNDGHARRHRIVVQGNGSTTVTTTSDDDDQFVPPVPPMPPVPPIPTVSWRKSDRPKGKRPAAPTVPVASKPVPGLSSKPVQPAWFPKSEADEEAAARPDAQGFRVLLGRLSASEDRARQDLRQLLERDVTAWIAADVPPSWKVPASVIDGMLRGSYVQEVTWSLTEKDARPTLERGESASKDETASGEGLYTLHRAGQKVDFSANQKARIIKMYRRDLASQRMQRLGGGLALALVGLAVLSGYIKADEATKGYYTNRLRLVAAAGLGVAGVAAYRFLV